MTSPKWARLYDNPICHEFFLNHLPRQIDKSFVVMGVLKYPKKIGLFSYLIDKFLIWYAFNQ